MPAVEARSSHNFNAVLQVALAYDSLSGIPPAEVHPHGYRIVEDVDLAGHPITKLEPVRPLQRNQSERQFKSVVLKTGSSEVGVTYHIQVADDNDRILFESQREARIERMPIKELEELDGASSRDGHRSPRKGFSLNIITEKMDLPIKIGSVTIEEITLDRSRIWHISSTYKTGAQADHPMARIIKKVLSSICSSARKAGISAITCVIDDEKPLHGQEIHSVMETMWRSQSAEDVALPLSAMTPGRRTDGPTPCQVLWQNNQKN